MENSETGIRERSNGETTEQAPCKCPNTELEAVQQPTELNYFGKVQVEVVPAKTSLNNVLTDENSVVDMVQQLIDLLGKIYFKITKTMPSNFSANDADFAESDLYKEAISKLTNYYREQGIIGETDTISIELRNPSRRKRQDTENGQYLAIVINSEVSGTASETTASAVQSTFEQKLVEAGQISENDTVKVDNAELYPGERIDPGMVYI